MEVTRGLGISREKERIENAGLLGENMSSLCLVFVLIFKYNSISFWGAVRLPRDPSGLVAHLAAPGPLVAYNSTDHQGPDLKYFFYPIQAHHVCVCVYIFYSVLFIIHTYGCSSSYRCSTSRLMLNHQKCKWVLH